MIANGFALNMERLETVIIKGKRGFYVLRGTIVVVAWSGAFHLMIFGTVVKTGLTINLG